MEAKLCQSCGMPLSSAEVLGTNADGSLNEEYCTYCYQHGNFAQDCTMDEMIEHCAQFTDEFNKDSGMNFTKEEAIAGMKEFFTAGKRKATSNCVPDARNCWGMPTFVFHAVLSVRINPPAGNAAFTATSPK